MVSNEEYEEEEGVATIDSASVPVPIQSPAINLPPSRQAVSHLLEFGGTHYGPMLFNTKLHMPWVWLHEFLNQDVTGPIWLRPQACATKRLRTWFKSNPDYAQLHVLLPQVKENNTPLSFSASLEVALMFLCFYITEDDILHPGLLMFRAALRVRFMAHGLIGLLSSYALNQDPSNSKWCICEHICACSHYCGCIVFPSTSMAF